MSTSEQLTIDTPEQIPLAFSLASIGSRFLALAIDTAFQALGFAVLVVLATLAASLSFARLQPWEFAALLVVAFVIYYGYFALFEIWWGGQTPGKRTIGLRVIAVSGRPITPFEATLRNLVRIADQLPGMYAIGIVSVFLSRKHQRLGDFAAGTVVVHERPLDLEPAPETPAVHVRRGAARLAADDILVIDAFLRRRHDLTPERRERAASAIAARIRQRLEIVSADAADEPFLEEIVAEYPVDERLSLMLAGEWSGTANRVPTFEVALRTSDRSSWRTFADPVAIFGALEPDDVSGCLAAVDRAVEEGAYAAGFISYEAAASFGCATHVRRAGFLPLACFGIYPPDHVTSGPGPSARDPYRLGDWRPSIPPEAGAAALQRLAERELPQVVFASRLCAAFEGEPRALMADLDAARGGLMSAFIDTGTHAICAAASELLFRLDRDTVECRPVSGRYPRGLSAAADRRHGGWLRDSETSRSDHAAIVAAICAALEAVAEPGSVRTSPFDAERSPLWWQMTSTVTAQVLGPTLAVLAAALFPSPSVSGVPRPSAMAAIKEVEAGSRGLETGAVGYLSPRGRGQFFVAHEPVVIDREQREAEIGVEQHVGRAPGSDADRGLWLLEPALLFPRFATPAARAAAAHVVSYVAPPRPDFRLLEAIKWTPADGFVLLDRHVDRLGESAACFGFDCDLVEVRRVLAAAVEDVTAPAKVRILVSRDGAIACEAIDLTEPAQAVVRVALAPDPIDARDLFLYHQTTRRAAGDRTRAGRPGVDAFLLWNDDGEVTEAAGRNLVVELDGVKVTPPVEAGVLPGTLRAELLALGELVERRVTREEVRRAARLWLIDSISGWIEATLVE